VLCAGFQASVTAGTEVTAGFQAVGATCPVGVAERPAAGKAVAGA
jgi:hypothetical protein